MKIWKEIKKRFYDKIPKWVSPLEAFIKPTLITRDKRESYENLLDRNINLKTEVVLQNTRLTWWGNIQLKTGFNKDMKTGFYRNKNDLDKIWLSSNDKMVQKMYNFLLEEYLQDEVVKSTMVAWVKDIECNMDIESKGKGSLARKPVEADSRVVVLISVSKPKSQRCPKTFLWSCGWHD